MPPASLYHPVWFFFIVMLSVLAAIVTLFIPLEGVKKLQTTFFMLFLCLPCITALLMIFASQSEILIADFWKRLLLFKIGSPYLGVILFLMPIVVCLSIAISLFFGFSANQFSIAKEMSVMKVWPLLGVLIPIVLAPLFEELGWRGYGVDSLRVYFNLFTTSVIFGLLWAAWHLPPFFIKGYFHNQLWNLGIIYVINFFVSVFVLSFLINWIYYKTGRSIPAAILFHAIANLSIVPFRIEPFTKCIVTVLLAIVAVALIIFDSHFFFGESRA